VQLKKLFSFFIIEVNDVDIIRIVFHQVVLDRQVDACLRPIREPVQSLLDFRAAILEILFVEPAPYDDPKVVVVRWKSSQRNPSVPVHRRDQQKRFGEISDDRNGHWQRAELKVRAAPSETALVSEGDVPGDSHWASVVRTTT